MQYERGLSCERVPLLEDIERRRRDILLEPYPSDRAAAENAIRRMYRAADRPEPHHLMFVDYAGLKEL